ncbi:MAG TPA: hypothetical protein VFP84_16990 [Kofleriaceae bacterium]|nr:hypothetical protein [Kofleriaceae bacterium]
MLVRPQDLEQSVEAPQEAAPDVAPAEPEVVEAAPEVAPEAPASEAPVTAEAATETGETASEQAFADKSVAPTSQLDSGMFYPEVYQQACVDAGTPDKWDPKYARGHTEAAGWTQPHDGRYDMAFELKKGHSASQAVRDFLAGPTIADYRVIGVAVEMDELRDDLGDQRFDEMFGSRDTLTDAKISGAQRLKITSAMYTIPFAAQMLAMAAENEALDKKTEEPEAPAVEARQEELPAQGGVTAEPAPELIADELGMQREEEVAFA